jgi:hypothetical protein
MGDLRIVRALTKGWSEKDGGGEKGEVAAVSGCSDKQKQNGKNCLQGFSGCL